LRFTKETTPGTFNTAATSADKTFIRITGDNAFPDRSIPNIYYVRDAAASNRNVQVDFGTKTATGRFESLVYASQAKLLLPWGCNLVSAGLSFALPYTFTVDHLLQLEGATFPVLYKRYLGVTCQDMMLKAGNQGDAQKFALSATFWYLSTADITVTDFATPALTDYPSDLPMKFQQLAGGVTINSSAVVGFKSYELTVKNMTKGIYDESEMPQFIGWYGRDVSFRVEPRFKSSAERAAFDGVTARSATVILTDGTNTITFDHKSQNIITSLSDSTPLGDAFYQNETISSMVDATAGTDFVCTITP
jgi:hypothetical protein